jgi:hypothetical protein
MSREMADTPFRTAECLAMNRTTLVAIGVLLYFCLQILA